MIKHKNGIKDSRYSVTKEWCGQIEAKYILRFCGEWIGWYDTKVAAWLAGEAHQANRMSALVE